MNPSVAVLDPARVPEAAPAGLAVLDDPLERDTFTEWRTGASGRREGISRFQLAGMYCAACAGTIEDALAQVDGVLDAQVSASSERAEVRWDPARTRPSQLVDAVRRAGYGAVPDAAAPARAQRVAEQRRSLWRLFVAGFCMMQVMMYATPAYVAEPGDITPDMLRLLQWASWLLSLPVLVFSAGPFFQGAWRSLRLRRIGMDVPVALGIAVTFVASSGATFQPGGWFGHEVYFDSLTMFVFFLLGGRHLEVRARHRVAEALESAVSRLPDSVQRLDAQGAVETVAIGRLAAGDRVRVAAGQAFPADGDLLDGSTLADEALLTGESAPVPKGVGDRVVAGSLNLGAPVLMRVQRLGADTRYEGIVTLMRDALTQRPETVRQVDRIAAPFLWAVLVLAGGAAAAWSVIDPSRAVWVAVSVLIVTCPCALSLSAPSALLAAAGALARRGVLLRRLEALETLARVDQIFLDKTGTLTEDRLQYVAMHAVDGTPDDAGLLARAAALAAYSQHPAARALAAAGHGAAAPTAHWHDIEDRPGQGLQARDAEGRSWRLGRRVWVDGTTPEADDTGLTVWFACDGVVRARFELSELVRADAAQTVQRLRAQGLEVALLSGDTPARAQALAARLGIVDVRGGATPEAKLAAMAQAQAGGHAVAMVGDGLNDAPVLARADVSFAFAHGAAVARSGADAVLLGTRLADVADARDLARRTMRVIRQNFVWAAAYNGLCIPLALAGWLPPWAAGIGMASSSLLVVLNALRLSRLPEGHA